jgi:uridylate kinase
MYRRLSYDHFLQARMGVMDSTAVTLCRDNRLPIRVFALSTRGNIKRVVQGEPIGTLVSEVADVFASQPETQPA